MKLNVTMEEYRVSYIVKLIVVLATNIQDIHGQECFFTDFMEFLETASPVFISTNQFDEDLGNVVNNDPINLIIYIPGEEKEVALYLRELYLMGEVTIIVFLNEGHQNLLNLLMNTLNLFTEGLSGLLPESDVSYNLNNALRLDSKIYVYANCGETIDLKEMYALNGKKILKKIGVWNENKGLTVFNRNMWERRINMEGITLRVATLNVPFYHELYYDQSGTSIVGGGGFFLEPLNILAIKLNFTIKLMISKDGQWGAPKNNDTWSGMIGMLIEKETDIAAAAFTETKERANVIKFGSTLVDERTTLISAGTAGPKTDPLVYLKIFPPTAWYLIGVMVIIIAMCFATINHFGINYMHYIHDSEKFTVLNGLGLSMTFFRQIYYDVNIKGISTKILFILSAVSTYLLYVHYTAYLTAASTSVEDTSIKSFRDVLSGGYNVFVWEDTTHHDDLKHAKPGTAMHEVYYKTMNNNPSAFVHSADEAMMFKSEKALYYGHFSNIMSKDGLTLMDIQGLLQVNFRPRE